MKLKIVIAFFVYTLLLIAIPYIHLNLLVTILAQVVLSAVFYVNFLDDVVHKAVLYLAAEPGYVESLARYRGTLNSSHGLPKGWVITYDNSLDKHEYHETGEKGDDNLSFIVNFLESGYLQIEGTANTPTINFYPKRFDLQDEDKIKVKVIRNGTTIFNQGYPQ